MKDKRYSVMVLPYSGGRLLLQSFDNDSKTIFDGFGCFHDSDEDSEKIAMKVISDFFNTKISSDSLHKKANLNYFINKPAGLVDLSVTVFFAEIDESLSCNTSAKWFDFSTIPFSQMHAATAKWLPLILNNDKVINASIKIDQPGDHTQGIVTEYTLR